MTAAVAERLPTLAVAPTPAERGLARDGLRMLVAHRRGDAFVHRRLRDLPDVLAAGDVLVVNTSAVVPAALPGVRSDGSALRVHLSARLPGGDWIVELRLPDGCTSSPFGRARAGEELVLPAGGRLQLRAPHQPAPLPGGVRLWQARVDLPADVGDYLAAHGRPVRYTAAGADGSAPAQTIFAREPGSVEPPSAALGFTGELVARLVAAGIELAPVLLHCGVSSLEAGEAPHAERYAVSASTARRVNAARAAGGRIVAVGTTATRALETVAGRDGQVRAGRGWTEHLVTPATGVRAVDGLLTGWHEPEASHLELITAVAGRDLVARSYREAAAAGYLGHEWGDLHLLLP